MPRSARSTGSTSPRSPGRRVYLDTSYLDTYYQEFVAGELRAKLMSDGALLVPSDEAEVVAEGRSAGLSSNKKDLLIGLPGIPLPLPTVGTVETPELALIKNFKRRGVGAIGVLAWEKDSREFILDTRPNTQDTLMNDWSVLGLKVIRQRKHVPKVLE